MSEGTHACDSHAYDGEEFMTIPRNEFAELVERVERLEEWKERIESGDEPVPDETDDGLDQFDRFDRPVVRAIHDSGQKQVSLKDLKQLYRTHTQVRNGKTLRNRIEGLTQYGPFEHVAPQVWEFTGVEGDADE